MRRVIAVAGGGRRVGKTSLAESLVAILGDAAAIKIGAHPVRGGKNPLFFPAGTRLAEVVAAAGDRSWIVVESGAVLDDPEADVALVIFLPAAGPDKPGSERHRARAHIVRGRPLGREDREAIRERLGVDGEVVDAIVDAVEGSAATRTP
jgi:hypothetical protein